MPDFYSLDLLQSVLAFGPAIILFFLGLKSFWGERMYDRPMMVIYYLIFVEVWALGAMIVCIAPFGWDDHDFSLLWKSVFFFQGASLVVVFLILGLLFTGRWMYLARTPA